MTMTMTMLTILHPLTMHNHEIDGIVLIQNLVITIVFCIRILSSLMLSQRLLTYMSLNSRYQTKPISLRGSLLTDFGLSLSAAHHVREPDRPSLKANM